MAVKNFIFREKCVGSVVAGMKIAFFAFFLTQPGPMFLSPKGPNMEFLIQNLKNRGYIITSYVNLRLTK